MASGGPGTQAVIAFDIGLWFALKIKRLWRVDVRPADRRSVDQPVEKVGVCQTSCPPDSGSVSAFRGADIGFWIEPDGSSRMPVSGLPDQRCGFCDWAFA